MLERNLYVVQVPEVFNINFLNKLPKTILRIYKRLDVNRIKLVSRRFNVLKIQRHRRTIAD